jgi:hypothetical protein
MPHKPEALKGRKIATYPVTQGVALRWMMAGFQPFYSSCYLPDFLIVDLFFRQKYLTIFIGI